MGKKIIVFVTRRDMLRGRKSKAGGNKIKRFGDGEKNQKLEKKKKENF